MGMDEFGTGFWTKSNLGLPPFDGVFPLFQ